MLYKYYKMRLSLVLFIIGFSLVLFGYGNQLKDSRCTPEIIVKHVPRHVYDEIAKETSRL